MYRGPNQAVIRPQGRYRGGLPSRAESMREINSVKAGRVSGGAVVEGYTSGERRWAGGVMGSGFWSRRIQFHLQLASPKAKYAAHDHKGPRASGHACFVPLTAKPPGVTPNSEMQVENTNLKRDAGNSKNCLCNRAQLSSFNFLLIPCEYGTTDLCEGSAIFNCPVHGFLY